METITEKELLMNHIFVASDIEIDNYYNKLTSNNVQGIDNTEINKRKKVMYLISELNRTEFLKFYRNVFKSNYVKEKKVIIVKILNKILINNNLDTIKKIKEFTAVKKEHILLKKNDNIINEMEEEIFSIFKKATLSYHMKNRFKSYLFVLLKNACNDIGYDIISFKKNIKEADKVKNCTYICILKIKD